MKNSTALILLIISVALFFTFTSPNYDKVKALRTQAGQYQDTLSNIANLIKKRDDLLVKYNNIPADEISGLQKVLPDNVDTVTLAYNFDSIAAKYGITLKSVRTLDSQNQSGTEIVQSTGNSPYQSVTVSIEFISSYENFRNFLNDIEKSLRIIDVKSVSFEGNDTDLYDFNISLQTYWLKPASAPTPDATS